MISSELLTDLLAPVGDGLIEPMAQARLQAFYRQHGFEPDGPIYIEDGIDHIEMVRAA